MKLNPTTRRARALTLIEVMFVIVALFILGAIWVKRNQRERAKSARISCAGRLKQIGLAFKVFASDHDDKFPFLVTNSFGFNNVTQAWLHFQAMSNECGSAKILTCPSDRERLPHIMSDFGMGTTAKATSLSTMSNRAVSYPIGLDGDETQPNVILSSDRHLLTNRFNMEGRLFLAHTNGITPAWTLTQHDGAGNLALSDGSVQQMTSAGLAAQVAEGQRSLGLTNRLLLPLLP